VPYLRMSAAVTRVRSKVRSRRIYGGKSGVEAGFLRVVRFPHKVSFHRLFHIHESCCIVPILKASSNNQRMNDL
jgi:hypothetical protein